VTLSGTRGGRQFVSKVLQEGKGQVYFLSPRRANQGQNVSLREMAEGSGGFSMMAFPKSKSMASRSASDGTVTDARDRIRAEILGGKLSRGAILSQVQLAKQMGVSRTPMREALRMLQEEGLVEIERNHRARVIGFDADDLEVLYSSRILLTAMATMLTVPILSNEDLERMSAAVETMRQATEANNLEKWRMADRDFHRIHCSLAPASALRELENLFARSTLYRTLRMRDFPHQQPATVEDHKAILAGCLARNVDEAVAAVVRHNARIALTLLAHTAPSHDPKAIRAALRLVLGEQTKARKRVTSK
jgi:DNA-binding GntR family transcriptional regulator